MGFERVRYKLDFEGTSWEGLEVRAKGLTLGEAMELQRLIDLGQAIVEPTEDREDDRQFFYKLLAKMLVSWNRTDDGEPVPISAATLAEEEFAMLQNLVRAYMRKVFTVDDPLSRPSSDTGPSEELFQLMENESPSPVS